MIPVERKGERIDENLEGFNEKPRQDRRHYVSVTMDTVCRPSSRPLGFQQSHLPHARENTHTHTNEGGALSQVNKGFSPTHFLSLAEH